MVRRELETKTECMAPRINERGLTKKKQCLEVAAEVFLLTIVFIFYLIALPYFFIKKGQTVWWHFLVTIGWFTLMLLPVFLGLSGGHGDGESKQHLGLVMPSLAIILGDWLGSKLSFKAPTANEKLLEKLGLPMALFVFAVCSTHLALMPKIPLIEKYFLNNDKADLLREESSKLLEVPQMFIYLVENSFLILGPLALCILLKNKRRALASVFALFLLFYSHSTLAKGPVLTLLIILGYILFSLKPPKLGAKVLAPMAVAFVLFGGFSIYTVFADPVMSPYKYTEPDDYKHYEKLKQAEAEQGLSITVADRYRLLVRQPQFIDSHFIKKAIIYLYYRIFLVPSEVSRHWYDYFPEKSGGFIGFYGLTPESRGSPDFVHPANEVGLWAYKQRFPDQYFDSIRAYASFDADAYARWSFLGIFIISLIYFAFRITVGFLSGRSIYVSTLVFIVLLLTTRSLPAGSLQAMMISKGIMPAMVILFFIRFISWKRVARANN